MMTVTPTLRWSCRWSPAAISDDDNTDTDFQPQRRRAHHPGQLSMTRQGPQYMSAAAYSLFSLYYVVGFVS